MGGGVVHVIHPVFAFPDLPPVVMGSSVELIQEHRDAAFAYRSRNYGLDLAIVGLTFGVFFGAFSLSRKRTLSVIAGGVIGALTGAVLGFVGGLLATQSILRSDPQDLQTSMGLQSIVWGLIFASVLWVVATLHIGAIRACAHLLIGLLAGFAVALVQFVISTMMYPSSNPMFLVPDGHTERICWLVTFPIVSGLILALGVARFLPKAKLEQSELSTSV